MLHTMTTAKWINPPSLEGRKEGWWGFKPRQAPQRAQHSQRQAAGSPSSAEPRAHCRRILEPPLSKRSKTENNIHSEGRQREKGEEERATSSGTWKIINFNIASVRLEDEEQGQA